MQWSQCLISPYKFHWPSLFRQDFTVKSTSSKGTENYTSREGSKICVWLFGSSPHPLCSKSAYVLFWGLLFFWELKILGVVLHKDQRKNNLGRQRKILVIAGKFQKSIKRSLSYYFHYTIKFKGMFCKTIFSLLVHSIGHAVHISKKEIKIKLKVIKNTATHIIACNGYLVHRIINCFKNAQDRC